MKRRDFIKVGGGVATATMVVPPPAQQPVMPIIGFGGPAFYAYSTNYLVDVEAGIIVDVEPTPAWRTAEVNSTRTMIERVEERFDLKPERLIGDMAYGATPMLEWLVEEKQIAPHIPVWNKSEPDDGTFGRSDLTFDAENNRYICPAGKVLKPAWRSRVKRNPVRYRASQ